MKTRHMFPAAAVILAAAPALAQTEVPLIPREILFSHPTRVSPKISPDGQQISFLAPVNGVLNVWVGPVIDPDLAEAVTAVGAPGVRVYQWAYTSEHILYQTEDPALGSQLHCTDLTSGDHVTLTPGDSGHQLSAYIQHISPLFPRDIIISMNQRDPRLHDLYVVNIDTGERMELQRNEEYVAFFTDDDFSVRVGMKMTPDGGAELCAMNEQGQWDVFTTMSEEDIYTTGPIGFDKTGDTIYMIDSRGRDTAALKSISMRTGAAKTLAKDRDADISGGVLIHPVDRTVQAASATYRRREWHPIDGSIKKDFKYLETVAEGEISVLSRTADDSQWIIAYEMDQTPVRYYRYDRAAGTTIYLFSSRAGIEGLPLAEMYDDVVRSRDRMNLVTYYTIPKQYSDRGKRWPVEPLPTVILVHGGPWARDYWGYDPLHQWLANRGYAVISVNYRGSTGFGKKFTSAADGEWGGKMNDDLIDVVSWAVKKNITDPQRVAIMGASFGGFATLTAMTTSPETFVCGVDIAGPVDLVNFMEAMPAYPQYKADLWARRVGDHRTEAGRALLMQRSPVSSLDAITSPLLIAQGAKDRLVQRSDAELVVETLQRNGVPVTYVFYPDEGHGIRDPQNLLSLYAVAESFLGQHLGGRVEPIGDDLDGSSIMIPAGGDTIVGVTP